MKNTYIGAAAIIAILAGASIAHAQVGANVGADIDVGAPRMQGEARGDSGVSGYYTVNASGTAVVGTEASSSASSVKDQGATSGMDDDMHGESRVKTGFFGRIGLWFRGLFGMR